MKTWEQRFKTLSNLACLGAIAISVTALIGFHFDRIELRQWFGEGPPMRANTALALLFAAMSLILQSLMTPHRFRPLLNRVGIILGFIPLFLGIFTLLEYTLHIGSGLDQLFYEDWSFPKIFPGRPSPDSALNLTMLGLALLLINRRQKWAQISTRLLSLLILALPMITLTSSLFGADRLYSLLPPHETAVGTATNTSVAFVLLSFALFFRHPTQGMAALFTHETMGGIIARRHLTALVAVPILMTFLNHAETFFGYRDRAVSLSVSLLLILGGLVAFNWITAKKLDRLDRLKQLDEQKLRDQERLLSGVLDAVPVGIWITDSSGKITRGNPAGIDIWRGERYVGIEQYGEYKGWWADSGELIGPHDWALARALEKGETSLDETIIIQCFDGSQKVIMNSAMPLRNENGDITGSIVTNYDISRRYRMEKNLALVARAGEAMISMRDFDQAFQQVATLMTTGLCDYCMLYKLEENGTLNMVARAGRDTAFAKRFDALVDRYPPNPRTNIGIVGVLEKRRSLLIHELTEDTIQSIAQDAHHAAELRQILHSYMLVPMVAEDKSIGILGFVSCDPARRYDDIDLLAAEEMGRLAAFAVENVRYAEKLRQAVQAREDVVAIVSHDLRSPLAVILQSCELINKQLMGQEVPASVMKLTSLAKSAGKRMHELISDLLDLSHLESGQFVLHRERLDCLTFLSETVDLIMPLATQKGVLLALEMPDELPPANADRTRMTQILNNLISNAIKHTPSGGSIDVQVRLRDDGWLEFVVSDTGCGIKREYLPQLFERYWKPNESKGGFGLGLFVVKGIIEAHGGSIHVTSEENKGTSFTFTIPSVLLTFEKNSAYRISHPQFSANAGQLLPTEQR